MPQTGRRRNDNQTKYVLPGKCNVLCLELNTSETGTGSTSLSIGLDREFPGLSTIEISQLPRSRRCTARAESSILQRFPPQQSRMIISLQHDDHKAALASPTRGELYPLPSSVPPALGLKRSIANRHVSILSAAYLFWAPDSSIPSHPCQGNTNSGAQAPSVTHSVPRILHDSGRGSETSCGLYTRKISTLRRTPRPTTINLHAAWRHDHNHVRSAGNSEYMLVIL